MSPGEHPSVKNQITKRCCGSDPYPTTKWTFRTTYPRCPAGSLWPRGGDQGPHVSPTPGKPHLLAVHSREALYNPLLFFQRKQNNSLAISLAFIILNDDFPLKLPRRGETQEVGIRQHSLEILFPQHPVEIIVEGHLGGQWLSISL